MGTSRAAAARAAGAAAAAAAVGGKSSLNRGSPASSGPDSTSWIRRLCSRIRRQDDALPEASRRKEWSSGDREEDSQERLALGFLAAWVLSTWSQSSPEMRYASRLLLVLSLIHRPCARRAAGKRLDPLAPYRRVYGAVAGAYRRWRERRCAAQVAVELWNESAPAAGAAAHGKEHAQQGAKTNRGRKSEAKSQNAAASQASGAGQRQAGTGAAAAASSTSAVLRRQRRQKGAPARAQEPSAARGQQQEEAAAASPLPEAPVEAPPSYPGEGEATKGVGEDPEIESEDSALCAKKAQVSGAAAADSLATAPLGSTVDQSAGALQACCKDSCEPAEWEDDDSTSGSSQGVRRCWSEGDVAALRRRRRAQEDSEDDSWDESAFKARCSHPLADGVHQANNFSPPAAQPMSNSVEETIAQGLGRGLWFSDALGVAAALQCAGHRVIFPHLDRSTYMSQQYFD